MYKFWGKVRKYNQRGGRLRFPTANINLRKDIPEGIYISKTKVANTWHGALTFIGQAKTFGDKKYQAETYILDFHQGIYGKWISVKLLKKIRGNQKFESVDELIKQMKKDEIITRTHFKLISG